MSKLERLATFLDDFALIAAALLSRKLTAQVTNSLGTHMRISCLGDLIDATSSPPSEEVLLRSRVVASGSGT